jgi:hypothetical protein
MKHDVAETICRILGRLGMLGEAVQFIKDNRTVQDAEQLADKERQFRKTLRAIRRRQGRAEPWHKPD